MQKLPEAPDRKYERRMRKEKEPFRQKKEIRSLSAVTFGLKTPITFMLEADGHVSIFYAAHWLSFPLVAAISVNNN